MKTRIPIPAALSALCLSALVALSDTAAPSPTALGQMSPTSTVYTASQVDAVISNALASIEIPDLDMSDCATISNLDAAVAAMHPDFHEWASPAIDRIAASVVAPSTTTATRGDAIVSTGAASGYALRAIRSVRSGVGMDSEIELPGTWSIVGDAGAANLSSNVLSSTSRPGDVTVEFSPAALGAATMRTVVSMPGDAVRAETVWPAGDAPGSWRDGFAFAPTGGIYTVSTSRWHSAIYVCTNWPGSPPDWYASPPVNSGGGLVGLAPHYAASSAHCGEYGPRTWVNGAPSGRGVSIATFGDLRILRMPNEVPAECRARFLRSSVLASLSDSLLFRAVGCAHTQHGGVAPCLVEPRPSPADLGGLTWNNGWTYVGANREWRNATKASLRGYAHAAHGGDSGHPVWFQVGPEMVPVGLFHWADGAGECLLSDALLDKIAATISRDSGNAESLTFYSAEDLQ